MSNDIQECDGYRAFEKILEPDARGVGIFQTTDLRNWQKYVDQRLKPSLSIPAEILVQIETVKNLFLYSWFVYRFGVVAKNQIYNVTELALNKRFELEKMSLPNGLRGKLEKALAEEWFDDGSFPHLEGQRQCKEKSRVIVHAIASLRNDLNHGSTMLFDPLSLIELSQNSLAIIGVLFENKCIVPHTV